MQYVYKVILANKLGDSSRKLYRDMPIDDKVEGVLTTNMSIYAILMEETEDGMLRDLTTGKKYRNAIPKCDRKLFSVRDYYKPDTFQDYYDIDDDKLFFIPISRYSTDDESFEYEMNVEDDLEYNEEYREDYEDGMYALESAIKEDYKSRHKDDFVYKKEHY